ncbi:MAG: hypothetical protein FD180_1379 [Planctomycetota bacterium]|nr:MAG: hypothetical protein FD180_1379 [Planctomycetota bacterium]
MRPAGRVEAWLIGAVRGGTKRGIPRDRVGELPEDDVDVAVAAAGDFWLVAHSADNTNRKVVRVTPK